MRLTPAEKQRKKAIKLGSAMIRVSKKPESGWTHYITKSNAIISIGPSGKQSKAN
jgi:hypothetical protein